MNYIEKIKVGTNGEEWQIRDPEAKPYADIIKESARAVNLLVNSYFRNPVNQRGNASYSGAGYSIDRWRAYHATTTHTITSDGIKVSATDANAAMYQILDVSKLKTNKKYTAAAMDIDGNKSIWTGYITNTSAGAGVAVYVSGSNTLFRIYGSNTWVWAALYEGEYTLDTLPEYQPKGYTAELAECRRYFKRLGGVSTGYVGYGSIYSSADKQLIITLPMAGGMIPDAKISAVSNGTIRCFSEKAESYEVSSVTYYSQDSANLVVVVTMVSALDGGKTYLLRTDNTAYIDIIAD